MKYTLAAAIAAVCIAGSVDAHAAEFKFATLDDAADPTFNQLLGINNSGVIAGYFGSGLIGHPNKGYTIAPPYKTFNSDNVPGSVQTQATGINAFGATVGFWSDTNMFNGTSNPDNNFGFLRLKGENGAFLYAGINDPLVAGTPRVNQVLGINRLYNTVGFYNDANGASHGFAYSIFSNAFVPINVPTAKSTAATGLNDRNLLCGFYVNQANVTVGFVKYEGRSEMQSFRVPGASVTQLLGINNHDQAVGFYVDANNATHGLFYNAANGRWQRVDDPNGVNGTVVNGLNDKGQLVGFYTDAAMNVHGMVVTVRP